MLEKAIDAAKPARTRFTGNDQFLLFRFQFKPRDVERNRTGTRETLKFGKQGSILRFSPRFDRAFVQGLSLIWNHQVKIEINRVTESLAARTSSIRIVERKQSRFGLIVTAAVALTFKTLGKA